MKLCTGAGAAAEANINVVVSQISKHFCLLFFADLLLQLGLRIKLLLAGRSVYVGMCIFVCQDLIICLLTYLIEQPKADGSH